jgi:protein-disulfide isomerase-like protein with CxxC motif
MTPFDLSFDYRCPFAKNLHLHVLAALAAGADFDVTFVPWTLNQGYRAEGAPDVWDDPAYDADHLSMCAGVSVRDQQPELFLAAHEALFRARHEGAVRLVTLEEIAGVLAPLGVDMALVSADIESRRPHKVIGQSYAEFTRYEAFGVPTMVVDGDAAFVRYMSVPSGDAQESVRIVERLLHLMVAEPELNEFKHTQQPY